MQYSCVRGSVKTVLLKIISFTVFLVWFTLFGLVYGLVYDGLGRFTVFWVGLRCFGLIYGFLGWLTVFLNLLFGFNFDLEFLGVGLGKERILISRESKTIDSYLAHNITS